jgi:hypothetical protein
VWQALHAELEPLGFTVVTVALDVDPANATPWIDAAAPTHPSLIDTGHVTNDLFGFVNVPMSVWINKDGMIVRPAELASLEARVPRELPPGMPERIVNMMAEVNKIPDVSGSYRAMIDDWAARGSASEFVLSPDEVIEHSRPYPMEHARAAAHHWQRSRRSVVARSASPEP